jgi:hypothetical protein
MAERTLLEAAEAFDQQPWRTERDRQEAQQFLNDRASEVEQRVSDGLIEQQAGNRARAERGGAILDEVQAEARELIGQLESDDVDPIAAANALDALRRRAQDANELIVEAVSAQGNVQAGLADVWQHDHDLRARYGIRLDFPW